MEINASLDALAQLPGAFIHAPPRAWDDYRARARGGLLLLREPGSLQGAVAWRRDSAAGARLEGLVLRPTLADADTLTTFLMQVAVSLGRQELQEVQLPEAFAQASPFAEEALVRAGFEARAGGGYALRTPAPGAGPSGVRIGGRVGTWALAFAGLTCLSAAEGQGLLGVALVASLLPATCAAAGVEEWSRRQGLSFRRQLAWAVTLVPLMALAGLAQLRWLQALVETGSASQAWAAVVGGVRQDPFEFAAVAGVWGGGLALSALGPWAESGERLRRVGGALVGASLLGGVLAALTGLNPVVAAFSLPLIGAILAGLGLVDRFAALVGALVGKAYQVRRLRVRYRPTRPPL